MFIKYFLLEITQVHMFHIIAINNNFKHEC